MSQITTQESARRRIANSNLARRSLISLTVIVLLAPMARAVDIVPEGAEVEELWNAGEFTEGVAVAPDGTIYFSDIPAVNKGRILKFAPATGETTVFCADSGKSNGLMFDREGRLIAACGANDGLRAICEFTPDGKAEVLTDGFLLSAVSPIAYNSPNDLVIHPNGTVYFTDPRYVGEEKIEAYGMNIFRFRPLPPPNHAGARAVVYVTSPHITKPNGIVCSPDGKILYIAETNDGSDFDGPDLRNRKQLRSMKLFACPISGQGDLEQPQLLVDFGEKGGIDGMTVDQEGHIYAAVREPSRPGIVVFDPTGNEVAYIKTDVLPSNCCFGRGDEASTLYITAGGGLYRIPLSISGFHPATAELE